MNKKQILDTCKELAESQGSYGRLYEALKENEEALEYLEKQNFKDAIDFILFIEG